MTPTDTLPPIVEQILAYTAILLALLTALAGGLRWLVPQLRVIASRTKTTADDAVVDWLARALTVIATVVDVAQVVLPRVSLGRPADPHSDTRTSTVTVTETRPPVVPPANGPGGAALLLLVASLSLLAPTLGACGGAQTVSGGAACSSLMLLIGERADYSRERAVADIDAVSEVCRRLSVAPVADAGTP